MAQGKLQPYAPGDWVQVGKHTAREMIAAGDAVDPFERLRATDRPQGDVGVMLFGQGGQPSLGELPVCHDGVWEVRWTRTLFLDRGAPIVSHLIPAGFALLERWELAVPMWDYVHLAAHEGTDEEREWAQSIIHDLRVPLYDTRMVFARRCQAVERLLEMWHEYGGSRLAFLVALYRARPLVRALPCTWTGHVAQTSL